MTTFASPLFVCEDSGVYRAATSQEVAQQHSPP